MNILIKESQGKVKRQGGNGKRVRGGCRIGSAWWIVFSLEALAVLLQTVRLLAAATPCVHARLLHNLVHDLWRKCVDIAALDRLV